MEKRKNKAEEVMREMVCMTGLHLRAKEDGTDSRTISGYAILFNVPSAPFWEDDEEVVREVIDPSAISKEFLDGCDIMMTMFHDNSSLLARSKQGSGTLSYEVDEKGVSFTFDAPNTTDGDKAIELVKRGDIAGCSFAFRTHYYDDTCVASEVEKVDGKTIITHRVKKITDVRDFTLTGNPAYPQTSVEARELAHALRREGSEKELTERAVAQIKEMHREAKKKLFI